MGGAVSLAWMKNISKQETALCSCLEMKKTKSKPNENQKEMLAEGDTRELMCL